MIPFRSIAEESEKGGNVRIQWQTTNTKSATTTKDGDCFRLFDGKSSDAMTIASPTAVGETKDETVVPKETPDAKSSKRPRIAE
jgi:ribosomal 50S subunit-recycling heat shock protein